MAVQLNDQPVFGQFGNDAELESYQGWYVRLREQAPSWGLICTGDTRGQVAGVLRRFRHWCANESSDAELPVEVATRKEEGTGFRGYARVVT